MLSSILLFRRDDNGRMLSMGIFVKWVGGRWHWESVNRVHGLDRI
jgi:hypothetical protein